MGDKRLWMDIGVRRYEWFSVEDALRDCAS